MSWLDDESFVMQACRWQAYSHRSHEKAREVTYGWQLVAAPHVSFALSAQELKRFRRDGFHGPFDMYEPEEMERALQATRQ
jgi:hypothetical protein